MNTKFQTFQTLETTLENGSGVEVQKLGTMNLKNMILSLWSEIFEDSPPLGQLFVYIFGKFLTLGFFYLQACYLTACPLEF